MKKALVALAFVVAGLGTEAFAHGDFRVGVGIGRGHWHRGYPGAGYCRWHRCGRW